jgi:hypothetical protein
MGHTTPLLEFEAHNFCAQPGEAKPGEDNSAAASLGGNKSSCNIGTGNCSSSTAADGSQSSGSGLGPVNGRDHGRGSSGHSGDGEAPLGSLLGRPLHVRSAADTRTAGCVPQQEALGVFQLDDGAAMAVAAVLRQRASEVEVAEAANQRALHGRAQCAASSFRRMREVMEAVKGGRSFSPCN